MKVAMFVFVTAVLIVIGLGILTYSPNYRRNPLNPYANPDAQLNEKELELEQSLGIK